MHGSDVRSRNRRLTIAVPTVLPGAAAGASLR